MHLSVSGSPLYLMSLTSHLVYAVLASLMLLPGLLPHILFCFVNQMLCVPEQYSDMLPYIPSLTSQPSLRTFHASPVFPWSTLLMAEERQMRSPHRLLYYWDPGHSEALILLIGRETKEDSTAPLASAHSMLIVPPLPSSPENQKHLQTAIYRGQKRRKVDVL